MNELVPDNRIDPSGAILDKIGQTILGPYLVEFCRWLHNRKAAAGNDAVLLFVARDAHLPLNVYRTLFQEDSEACAYLLASRFSARLMTLETASDVDRLLVPGWSRPLDQSEVMHSLIDSDSTLTHSELSKRLLAESRLWRQRYHDHLRRLVKGRHPIVVDVGYRGSTQALVARILGVPVSGLYLVTHRAARTLAKDVGPTAAFDADFVSPHFSDSLINRHRYLFETILAEPAGTFLAFGADEQACFEPILSGTETASIVAALARGVMKFAAAARAQAGLAGENPKVALARLLDTPLPEEAAAFAGLAFGDRFMGIVRRYIVIPPAERVSAYALWTEAQRAVDERDSSNLTSGSLRLPPWESRMMHATLGTAQYACYATNRPMFLRENGGRTGLFLKAFKGTWKRWYPREM